MIKIKKVILSFCLILIMLLVSACGNNENVADDNSVSNSTNDDYSEFDYSMVVNGVEYNFPLTYDEIKSRGWKPNDCGIKTAEDFENFEMSADTYGTPFVGGANVCSGMDNGDIVNAAIIFRNQDVNNAKKIKDCEVIGMQFDDRPGDAYYNYPVGKVSVKGAKGEITLGVSNSDDVANFFDGKYFYMEDDGFISFTYDEKDVVETITFYLK